MAIPIEHFTFVRADLLTDAPSRSGQVEVIADHWWAMRGEEVAFYRGRSPQCNSNRIISEKLARGCDWCTEVRFIPRILVPFHMVDVYVAGEYDGPDRRYQFPGWSSEGGAR